MIARAVLFFRLFSLSFGDGVIAALTVWVASENAPYGEPEADEEASLFERLYSVL